MVFKLDNYMNTINTVEEFLEKMGPMFHTRLMMLHEAQVKDEYKQDDDTIVHFTFPEGEYSIRLGLLKERADTETLNLLDDNGLELKLGPLSSNQSRIKRKEIVPQMIPMKNYKSDNDNGSTV